MAICFIATIAMVHNGHFQQSSFNFTGWALESVAVRSCSDCENLQMRIAYLGFFGDPNDLGMFLVMCLPFTIYFYKRGRALLKIAMILQLAILIYGIYLTGSRGTMLGAGALLGIYYLVVNAGPKLIAISAILAPIAGVVVSSLQSDIDDSAQGRLYAWYEGIHMLISNPIFGIGKGNFVEEHGLVAHNSYVQVAGELGIPGYSLWGGCLILTMLTGFIIIKTIQKQNTDELSDEVKDELALNKTLFFSLCGFAVTAFFITRTYTLLLFIFTAMSLASNIRVVKCVPELKLVLPNSLIIKSMIYSWSIIVLVYISLKLTL
jgi:O-antigen ligase